MTNVYVIQNKNFKIVSVATSFKTAIHHLRINQNEMITDEQVETMKKDLELYTNCSTSTGSYSIKKLKLNQWSE